MKGKKFWMIAVGLLVALGLLVPAMAQEKKAPTPATKAEANKESRETMEAFFKREREDLVAELKLSPDKAKEFLAIGDKYDQKRQEMIDQIKKNEADLKQAVAASPPDESKIKSVVDDGLANQEKLFDTFKDQRKEEMGLLNPMQQAKYLMALMQWHKMKFGRIKK